MDKEQAAKHTYHVAKKVNDGSYKHAFDLRRRDDGGLGISNVEIPLSDAERSMLFAHFGTQFSTRGGGFDSERGLHYETRETRTPGTPEHFVAAIHRLPLPFTLIARVEK